jgi:hypothetical protein
MAPGILVCGMEGVIARLRPAAHVRVKTGH